MLLHHQRVQIRPHLCKCVCECLCERKRQRWGVGSITWHAFTCLNLSPTRNIWVQIFIFSCTFNSMFYLGTFVHHFTSFFPPKLWATSHFLLFSSSSWSSWRYLQLKSLLWYLASSTRAGWVTDAPNHKIHQDIFNLHHCKTTLARLYTVLWAH